MEFPDSLPSARSQLKRARTSIEKPRVRTPLKRYGSSNHDVFDFQAHYEDGIETEPRKPHARLKCEQTQSVKNCRPSNKDVASIGNGDSNSPSTAQCSANASIRMLPPPSKHKPAGHLQHCERQRIEASAPHSSACPKAWEGLPATFQEAKAGIHLDRANFLRVSQKPPEIDFFETQVDSVESSSSASSISSSKNITVSKQSRSGWDKIQPSSTLLSQIIQDTIPIALLQQQPQMYLEHDELSLLTCDPDSTITTSKETLRCDNNKKRKKEQVEEPGSDDTAIGIPKDQYQPRPTRSRYGCAGEVLELTDFSKRPKVVGKRKREFQRRKTTAFQELVPKSEDDDDEDNVELPRILPIVKTKLAPNSSARKKLTADLRENIDGICIQSCTKGQEPREAQKADKRGRPRKVDQVMSNIDPAEQIDDLVHKGVDGEHAIINPADGNVTFNTLEQTNSCEMNNAPGHAHTSHVELETGKTTLTIKKLRKKSTATKDQVAAVSHKNVRGSMEERGIAGEDGDLRSQILGETQGKAKTSETAMNNLPSISATKTTDVPPETPRKATSATQRGPDKHSPINSGTVAYRVGLSKRARIEPLLRMVRKC